MQTEKIYFFELLDKFLGNKYHANVICQCMHITVNGNMLS